MEKKLYVNTSEVRASALINFVLLGLAIFFERNNNVFLLILTLIYLIASFVASAWKRPLLSNRLIITGLKRVFGIGELEPSLPVRFSAKIGLTLSMVSLLTIGNGAVFFLIMCLLASALNAFTGICIACKLYPRTVLLKHNFSKLPIINTRK